MPVPPGAVFRAWTEQFDLWFAAPGSVLMTAAVNAVFFFETRTSTRRRVRCSGIRTMAGSFDCNGIGSSS
jgi:uncharacterized protein YndB with AHSA1/START domain